MTTATLSHLARLDRLARRTLLAALACASSLLSVAGAQAADKPSRIGEAVAAYQRGDFPGALAAFTELSKSGLPAADYNLAVMHLKQQIPGADRAEARRLMERAAEAGFVTAMYGMGRFLDDEAPRDQRDIPAANRWYERAAQAGSVDAQVAIGTAHYLGRGTPKDPTAAARWYHEAARSGDVGAQYLIASMYEQGDGVVKDLRLARYWYATAAANGDDAAPYKVKELDARMSAPL